MDIVKKIIVFAAGLVIVIGFVALGMGIYKKTKPVADNGAIQVSTILDGLGYDWTQFENNKEYTGSKVIEALQNVATDNDIEITVETTANKSAGGVVYTSADVMSKIGYTSNTKSADYINPKGTFKATVTTNRNGGRVEAITFTQN